MANTIVNIIGFSDMVINVTDAPEKVINKRSFEEVIVIVPGEGEEEGIFDFTFDDKFE